MVGQKRTKTGNVDLGLKWTKSRYFGSGMHKGAHGMCVMGAQQPNLCGVGFWGRQRAPGPPAKRSGERSLMGFRA